MLSLGAGLGPAMAACGSPAMLQLARTLSTTAAVAASEAQYSFFSHIKKAERDPILGKGAYITESYVFTSMHAYVP